MDKEREERRSRMMGIVRMVSGFMAAGQISRLASSFLWPADGDARADKACTWHCCGAVASRFDAARFLTTVRGAGFRLWRLSGFFYLRPLLF
uniref:Uncharacterized protein n=1 Tax=Arundo donax TaxID=35708 RepID=A0A0A8XRY5_ARUDO